MRISAETDEEIARARDRLRVQRARRRKRPLLLLLLLAGPGILTMLGENDGPSMISYAATGSSYGIGFFVPTILVTFVMAYVVQEAAMRVGVATQRGQAELIRERFGAVWATIALIDLSVGNLLMLAGEFVAISAGAAFLGVPRTLAVAAALTVASGAFLTRRYFTWERFAIILALGNLLFIPVALHAHRHAASLLRAAATWQPRPRIDAALVTLILANVGATVTPWMIFFQQSAVVDKGLQIGDLRHARIDTAAGAAIAAVVAIATLCIGAVLFTHHAGAASLRGGADFAVALLPYLGRHASTLFAIGMIEAGLTASVTISASSGYALGEVLNGAKSLNRGIADGAAFYGVIFLSLFGAAALVLVPHAPLFRIAILSNVAATLLLTPALVFLLLIARDRALMGTLANGRLATVACAGVALTVCALSVLYGALVVAPAL